jgi:hypothetical protein
MGCVETISRFAPTPKASNSGLNSESPFGYCLIVDRIGVAMVGYEWCSNIRSRTFIQNYVVVSIAFRRLS